MDELISHENSYSLKDSVTQSGQLQGSDFLQNYKSTSFDWKDREDNSPIAWRAIDGNSQG